MTKEDKRNPQINAQIKMSEVTLMGMTNRDGDSGDVLKFAHGVFLIPWVINK